ncbi:MAG TPA: outer membrane beta-barrel protein [Bradyrhizobium sp.]|nr:outer membrane beta-barrel protein [Bradyrhizobium sp.]
MKKIILAGASLLAMGMAAPASAADLAAKPYVKAPPAPVIAVYDWTGFYIGGNGGWGQAHACWDLLTPGGAIVANGCRDASGGFAGGQLGYRWQTGAWVWGVEGQGDWADIRGTRVSLFAPAFSTRAKVDGIGLITGQIGYAWNAALLYFKGGAAVTGNRFEILDTPTGTSLASSSSTRWGGAVGVGFEYGFTPNWSVGLEYDHLFMGHNNNSFSVVNPIVAGALNRISEDVDMVAVRFNYRFGGYGAPIAARY